MRALPTAQDVRQARKQAEAGITITFDAVRKPLFAVLGAVEAATQSVQKAYSSLAERGEGVFDEFRSRPRVKQALDSVESSVDTAQERLEVVVRDLNVAAADLRSRFARSSRSVGEKVARETQRATAAAAQHVHQAADEVSEVVTTVGDEAATEVRSAIRRTANRVAPPRRSATRRPNDSNTRGGPTQ